MQIEINRFANYKLDLFNIGANKANHKGISISKETIRKQLNKNKTKYELITILSSIREFPKVTAPYLMVYWSNIKYPESILVFYIKPAVIIRSIAINYLYFY